MLKVFGNRYEIGEMIGTGGMADVYIGEDQRLSRKVAVKVLRSDLARDPSFTLESLRFMTRAKRARIHT